MFLSTIKLRVLFHHPLRLLSDGVDLEGLNKVSQTKITNKYLDKPINLLKYELRPRELAFCIEYFRSGMEGKEISVVSAAMKAGYSESYVKTRGLAILRNKRIIAVMKEYNKRMEKALSLAADTIATHLTEIAMSNKEKNPQVAINAFKEINKMQGNYAPEKTITANINATLESDQVRMLVQKYEREF